MVTLFEQSRDEQLPSKGEQRARATRVENGPGAPAHLQRERRAVGELVGELLSHQSPQPPARERAGYPQRPGNGDRGDSRVEHLSELQVALHDSDLHGVEGVDDKDESEGPKRPDDARQAVKARHQRSARENDGVEGSRHGEAQPKHRGAIFVIGMRRLHEGRVKSGLDDDVAHVHEHEHDGERPELLWRKQTRHDDLNEKFDGGAPAAL